MIFWRLNFKAIVSHQIPAINGDQDGGTPERRVLSSGLHGVDVQMRLAGIARVAHLRDRIANDEALARAR